MAHEPVVRAQLVLRALNEVQKDEGVNVLQRLERQEPELAEFVMERLTDVQHQLWAAGLSDHESRRVYPRVHELVLTAVEAMRQGQAEILEGVMGDEDTDRGGSNTDESDRGEGEATDADRKR